MRSVAASLFFIMGLPLLIVLAIFTTHFQTNISAFVIAGDNAEEMLLASEIQSGTLSRRYILSIDAGEQAKVSSVFIQSWLSRLRDIPGVVDVQLANEQHGTLQVLSSLYAQHAAQLYSRFPQQTLAKIFNEPALAERAAAVRQALLSPQGQLIKKVLVHDPLLLSLQGFKNYAAQYKNKQAVSAQYANFILQTEMSGMDVPAQLQIQKQIQQALTYTNRETAKSYQLDMTGVPLFAAATQSMMEQDILLVSVISALVLSLLFVLIFRSLQVLFWVFSLLLTVMTVAVLVTNLVFGSVHGMTIAIGSTLIGICVDYPIHVLVHTQGLDLEQRVSLVKRLFPGLLMGAVTTLIGYMALGLSGYPGFQQVAVYSASGIIVSLLLTRYLFPQLMNATAKKMLPMPVLVTWLGFCQRYRRGLVGFVLLLSLAGILQLERLQWMQDLQQLTPEMNELKQVDKRIRQRMVSLEPGRFVLVSGDTLEQTLQRAEQVYLRLDQLQQAGVLVDYFGVYPWLLSQRQQLDNQRALLAALTDEQREQWRSALQDQGLSVKRLGKLDYIQGDLLSVQQVLNSPAAPLFAHQMVLSEQRKLIIIWLTEHQPEAIQAAVADMSHVQYFSQRDMLNRMAVEYQQRAQMTLLAGLGLIIALLCFRYKSIVLALQTLAPAFIAALLILVIWAWTGEVISFLHLLGFLLVVAVCVDYGIFYQENRSGHITLTYQAMLASMLTSALVFGCLIVAQTSMLQTLAKVVSSGVTLGFVLCPILIKPKVKV